MNASKSIDVKLRQKPPAGPETVRAGIAIICLVVLTKNQWRCGFVRIFIMHINCFLTYLQWGVENTLFFPMNSVFL